MGLETHFHGDWRLTSHQELPMMSLLYLNKIKILLVAAAAMVNAEDGRGFVDKSPGLMGGAVGMGP